jgi:hypothetical protein
LRGGFRLSVPLGLPPCVQYLSQLQYSYGVRHCCLVRKRSGGLYASSELAKRTAISKRSTAEGLADVVTSGACCEQDLSLLHHCHDPEIHKAKFNHSAYPAIHTAQHVVTRDKILHAEANQVCATSNRTVKSLRNHPSQLNAIRCHQETRLLGNNNTCCRETHSKSLGNWNVVLRSRILVKITIEEGHESHFSRLEIIRNGDLPRTMQLSLGLLHSRDTCEYTAG